MARKKVRGRPVSGILLLNKSLDVSSNKALQQVKRLYDAQKAGHTGSLDPLATGMLPICLGEATKVSAYLLNADKVYEVQCQLGQTTTTGDAEGAVLEKRSIEAITRSQIERILPEFTGDIEQVPPMYSALKHEGQRLYELARKGIEVERKSRQVTIYSIDLLGYQQGVLSLRVACSKGTYIRTLAEDMGEKLGCGAFVSALHRVSVGDFDEKQMITFEQLQQIAESDSNHEFAALDELLLPLDTGLHALPEIRLNDDMAYYFRQGQAVQVPNAPVNGLLRVYRDQSFVGIGEIDSAGRVAPKRVMQTSN